MSRYDDLDRDTLIRLLQRRDAERQLGLVWERNEIEADRALNDDYVALQLDPALSHGAAPWDNLIIEGDNFDALRALRASHKGALGCIYIAPPYNTGNRDFVYNDRFVDRTHRFRHSLWLEFMYRRLILAKELLADDGVIFVSIDDNELFRLGMLMDRVFGEDNFIANVIWQKVYSPKNTAQHFSDDHEYVVVYARNRTLWRPNPLPRSAAQDAAYRNPDKDSRGPCILRIATKPDDTVLDFFAGSGTLAQAVAKLNAEDGGTRRFILVSSTEATQEQPDKNLCRDVCAQRVRKVLGGYTNAKGEAVAGFGGGFAYLRVRRVPRHRLSQKLDHAEIWNALQLLHGRPLAAWGGEGFAVEGDSDEAAFAYLANAYPASVARMQAWLAARSERPATI